MIVRAGPPLRMLEIASASEVGDLSDVLRAFRDLSILSVKIRARDGKPRSLASSTLRSIAAHAPPSLRRLDLRIGTGAAFSDLAPLFRRTDLTKLEYLTVRDARFGEQLVDAVLGAPFAQQLATLDLALTELDASAAERLAAGRPPALTALFLSESVVAGSSLQYMNIWFEPIDHDLDEMLKVRFRPTWE
jgi:hypothetical protein